MPHLWRQWRAAAVAVRRTFSADSRLFLGEFIDGFGVAVEVSLGTGDASNAGMRTNATKDLTDHPLQDVQRIILTA